MSESTWDRLSRMSGTDKTPSERAGLERDKPARRVDKPAGQAMRPRGIVDSFPSEKHKDQTRRAGGGQRG